MTIRVRSPHFNGDIENVINIFAFHSHIIFQQERGWIAFRHRPKCFPPQPIEFWRVD